MINHPKIIVTPPGPEAKRILRKSYFLLSPPSIQFISLVVDSAEDCIIRDVDGNEYITFHSSSCVMNLGHKHTQILKALKEQSIKLLHNDPAFYCKPVLDLAEMLIKIVPGSFKKKVLYATSGSEAIDIAIKLAKWHTRRHRFLTFIGAFHGTTIGALSLSGSRLTKLRYFFPMLEGVVHVPYPYCYRCPFKQEFPNCNYWCVDFIEKNTIKKYLPHEEVAAIFVEPIQWMDGCIVPPPKYFKRLKKMTDRYGLILVDNECLTGMGRTGRWFGIDNWNVIPDIVCISGSLASGFPLGAAVSRTELVDWESNAHSSLLGGNPVACAVALKVIETLRKEHLVENGARMGRYLFKRLIEIKEKYSIIGDVRGKGLMIGIEFVKNEETKDPNVKAAKKIVFESWKRGLILSRSGGSTVLFSPPLSIKKELIDKGLELFEGSIATVKT